MSISNKKQHKSKSWIFLLLIFIATSFMSIGYAKINPIISEISGTVSAEPQDEIFITEVSYSGNNNANIEESEIISFYETTLNSKIVLSDTDVNSSISYDITIYNSNDIDFSFIDVIYDSSFYDNENIVFELTDLKAGDKIDSKGTISFKITFKYKDGVVLSSSSNVLNSYLNFRFLHPVNYIESSGTQYIDTGITPDNTTTFDITFAFHTIHETQAVLGTRSGMDDGFSFNLFLHKRPYYDNGMLRWDQGTVTGEYVDLPLNEWKKINIVKGTDSVTFTSNDLSVTQSIQNETWSLDSNIHVFTQNQTSQTEERKAKIKLYDFKIYKNGTIVREYIPVLDKNQTPCLYDKVSNTYFYNMGEDDFGYSMHDNIYNYIESSGTQYIDLGMVANEYTQVEMVMSLNSAYTETQSIFGARAAYGSRAFNMFWFNSLLRWDYNTNMNYPTNSGTITKPTYILANSSKVQINQDITEYTDTTSFNTGYNMYVFAVNNADTPLFLNAGMRVYYIKVRYNGEIVKNLIPVTNTDGTPCLYDLVEQTFILNKGEGSFTVSK